MCLPSLRSRLTASHSGHRLIPVMSFRVAPSENLSQSPPFSLETRQSQETFEGPSRVRQSTRLLELFAPAEVRK